MSSGFENTNLGGLWQGPGAETTLYRYLCFSHLTEPRKYDCSTKCLHKKDIYASVVIVQFDTKTWQKGADNARLFTRTSDL